jgi:hypothetical protein
LNWWLDFLHISPGKALSAQLLRLNQHAGSLPKHHFTTLHTIPLYHKQSIEILAMYERKTYFILPTSDYSTTHIKLGQIVTNIRLPYRPLSSPLNTTTSPLPEVTQAFKANYTFDHSKAISGALGVQAQFLAQLGSPIGADAEVSHERGDAAKWIIDRLETEFIEPTQKYVEDSVLTVPKVKGWLDQRKLTGAVYMVTGVKIAKGVKFANKKVRKVGVGGAATVDLTALTSAPMSAGPTGELEKAVEVAESYTSCSDFVWAYRVQRVYISWFGGKVKAKEKVGGDLAGVGSGYEAEEDDEDEEGEPQEIGKVALEGDVGTDMVPNGFLRAEEVSPQGSGGEEDEAFLCPDI